MHLKAIPAVLSLGLLFAACGDSGKNTSERTGRNTLQAAQGQGNGMFGAIFTTDENGDAVNKNIYASKEDVYLNGGPRKPGAAGLPDGDYYYLITDPGCKNRLAGPGDEDFDTSGKIITVEDGEFTELMPLFPYEDTPNKGGEYKVYVTSVENFDETEESGCFGFIPRYTKTDNFKVRPPKEPEEPDTFCISGYKWYDVDMDGEVDSPEVPVGPVIGGDGGPVAGITIVLTYPDDSTDTTETSTNGQWSFCGLEPGEYHVDEILPEGWVNTEPGEGGFDVEIIDEDVENLGFGNVCYIDDVLQAEPCELPVENGVEEQPL